MGSPEKWCNLNRQHSRKLGDNSGQLVKCDLVIENKSIMAMCLTCVE